MQTSFGLGPSITVGGRVITDVKNLIVLHGYASVATARCTPRNANAVAGYQVPAGKTLRIIAVAAFTNNGSGHISLGYGDTDVSNSGTADPTNAVNFGFGSGTHLPVRQIGTNPMSGDLAVPTNYTVPTGKYPFYRNDGTDTGVSVILYGCLE